MVHQIIYLCIILIFLAGIGSIEHLTWKECLRLFLIQVGLTFLYVRYRIRIKDTKQNGEPLSGKSRPYIGSLVVALTVVFVMTQFDPATSAATFGEPGGSLNPFFIVATFLSCVAFSTFAISRGHELRPRCLTSPDRIASIVIFATIGMSLGSKQVLGHQISGSDLLAQLKILSFLLIWFAVTRSFSDPDWKGLPDWAGRDFGIFQDRWKGTLVAVTALFVPTLIYGAYRTGAVVYHYQIGHKLFHQKEWDAGRNHYELARRLNKKVDLKGVQSSYLSDLAGMHLKQGNEREAQEVIGELRVSIYNKAEANRKVGDVYFEAEKWVEMVTMYGEFLDNEGKDTEVLDRLGLGYLHLGDSRGFMNMVEDYQYMPTVKTTTYKGYIFLGNVHFYRKDFEAALNHFEAASRLKPEDSYSLYKLGRTYLEQEEIEMGINQFQEAVKLDPDFVDAYYRLGVCYEKQGRREETIDLYEIAVELLPTHLDAILALRRLGENGS